MLGPFLVTLFLTLFGIVAHILRLGLRKTSKAAHDLGIDEKATRHSGLDSTHSMVSIPSDPSGEITASEQLIAIEYTMPSCYIMPQIHIYILFHVGWKMLEATARHPLH